MALSLLSPAYSKIRKINAVYFIGFHLDRVSTKSFNV